MIRFVNPIEPSFKAQALRLLVGPAYIIYGAVYTITFGAVSFNLPLELAKKLALERFKVKTLKKTQ